MNLVGKEKVVGIILLFTLLIPPIVFSFEFTSFLYPKEIMLSIFLILLLPYFLKNRERLFTPIPLIFFFILNLYLFLTFFYAKVPEQTLLRSMELFLVFITLVLISDLNRDGKYETYIEYGILLSGVFVAISLIVQYLDLLPVLFPNYSFYKQLYSVFGNQNLAGTYIAMVMVGILVRWDKFPMRDMFKFLSFFVLGCGLILSNSRSSWFSILIIMTFYFTNIYKENRGFNKKNTYILVSMLLGMLLALPFIYERLRYSFSDMDVGFRVRLWIYDGSIRMFLSNPFLGVGWGNFYYWSPKYLADALHSSYGSMHIRNELLTLHAHNDILELLSETGVSGLIFVSLFYLSPIFIYRNPYVWLVFILVSLLNPILISSSHLV
ncbi:MAG: O-antigen ligase family protein, partial [Candidatus Hydrogenedens sp.]